ncbi:MAG TPA: sulfurtransferase [Candidatus Dormibacteraeota bacterium]|nr:sulfurtransferase [Candidatus Dormibacteraeota bacterium]
MRATPKARGWRAVLTTLIAPAELAAHLTDPDWVILDCRFELARPAWGEQAFAQGHIPQAQYVDLDRDLTGTHGPRLGRHPLPDPAALAATLGRLGIDARVQVVAYDQGRAAYAARLWWLLRWLGHRAVAVLDGGLPAWEAEGLPLARAPGARAPRQFQRAAAAAAAVHSTTVAQALAAGELARGELLLVDARSAERFAGQNETLDAVAGHIPGARNAPFTANHDPQGRFLPAAELRRRWQELLGARPPGTLVAMCGSGVTACDNLLALEIAGLAGARLYAGSWSEWITDPARPVARGATPS